MPQHDDGSVVVIDARVAGASGDKYLGALLDLGGSKSRLDKVASVVTQCLPGTKKVRVNTSSIERGEIAAKLVVVESIEEVNERKGSVLASAVQKGSSRLGLSRWATRFAQSTMNSLLTAESRVHGHSAKDLHLHELGSADTLVDVLGTAFLADELDLSSSDWWSMPLPTGAGPSHFSERDYPNPAPAVAEILRIHGIAITPSKIEAELTTPTGAAITANLAKHFALSYPELRPKRIGYGAGSKEIKDAANILRIMVGERVGISHSHDEVVVLETNLDDVTGEVMGHAMDQLMEAGARDVTIGPVYMKKNRPGHVLSVIVDASKSEEIAEIIMRETGSLGVREIPVRRHISHRAVQTRGVVLDGSPFKLKIKATLGAGNEILREKAEYEDRKELARRTGKSLRHIDALLAKRKERTR